MNCWKQRQKVQTRQLHLCSTCHNNHRDIRTPHFTTPQKNPVVGFPRRYNQYPYRIARPHALCDSLARYAWIPRSAFAASQSAKIHLSKYHLYSVYSINATLSHSIMGLCVHWAPFWNPDATSFQDWCDTYVVSGYLRCQMTKTCFPILIFTLHIPILQPNF